MEGAGLSRFDVVSYSLLKANIYNLNDMYNSKLFAILQHFDKYEQNRCRKYIQSPYFNRSEELLTLYEAFLKVINGSKQNGGLDKPFLWSLLQPEQPYDDVRFRKYSSDLLKLIEGYLSQEIYEVNPVNKAINLIQSVGQRRIEKLYNSAVRSASRTLEKSPLKSSSFYLKRFEVENRSYELDENKHTRTLRSNLDALNDNLDIFYFAEKLRYYCAALSNKFVTEKDYKVRFINEIIEHIKQKDIGDILPISIYSRVLLTQEKEEETQNYYVLKKLLEEHALSFPQLEAMNIYISTINYCVRQINRGNQEFLKEIFELYEDLINKEIIFLNDELSPWHFKNLVVVALRLGKYEWTERFIHNYSAKLPLAFRQNAISYNLAQVYFYQKKHEKVIELLREVEYEDVAYNLGSKAMLLATYYETDEMEPLYSLFESFRAYLNRHRDIPVNRRKNYGNLIRFTRKLTRIMPGDQPSIEKFKKDLEETKNVASLNWLKEKLAELAD